MSGPRRRTDGERSSHGSERAWISSVLCFRWVNLGATQLGPQRSLPCTRSHSLNGFPETEAEAERLIRACRALPFLRFCPLRASWPSGIRPVCPQRAVRAGRAGLAASDSAPRGSEGDRRSGSAGSKDRKQGHGRARPVPGWTNQAASRGQG